MMKINKQSSILIGLTIVAIVSLIISRKENFIVAPQYSRKFIGTIINTKEMQSFINPIRENLNLFNPANVKALFNNEPELAQRKDMIISEYNKIFLYIQTILAKINVNIIDTVNKKVIISSSQINSCISILDSWVSSQFSTSIDIKGQLQAIINPIYNYLAMNDTFYAILATHPISGIPFINEKPNQLLQIDANNNITNSMGQIIMTNAEIISLVPMQSFSPYVFNNNILYNDNGQVVIDPSHFTPSFQNVKNLNIDRLIQESSSNLPPAPSPATSPPQPSPTSPSPSPSPSPVVKSNVNVIVSHDVVGNALPETLLGLSVSIATILSLYYILKNRY